MGINQWSGVCMRQICLRGLWFAILHNLCTISLSGWQITKLWQLPVWKINSVKQRETCVKHAWTPIHGRERGFRGVNAYMSKNHFFWPRKKIWKMFVLPFYINLRKVGVWRHVWAHFTTLVLGFKLVCGARTWWLHGGVIGSSSGSVAQSSYAGWKARCVKQCCAFNGDASKHVTASGATSMGTCYVEDLFSQNHHCMIILKIKRCNFALHLCFIVSPALVSSEYRPAQTMKSHTHTYMIWWHITGGSMLVVWYPPLVSWLCAPRLKVGSIEELGGDGWREATSSQHRRRLGWVIGITWYQLQTSMHIHAYKQYAKLGFSKYNL